MAANSGCQLLRASVLTVAPCTRYKTLKSPEADSANGTERKRQGRRGWGVGGLWWDGWGSWGGGDKY